MKNEERWLQAMHNLMNRRKSGGGSRSTAYSPAGDYQRHLLKVAIGKTVLDVGCGDMSIKKYLPDGSEYYGIDAFPVNEQVVSAVIEKFEPKQIPGYLQPYFETIIAFAVLDGVCDLEKALSNINKMASRNVVLLTGIDIEPDEFHTHKVTFETLNHYLNNFVITFKEELEPKVWLIQYSHAGN